MKRTILRGVPAMLAGILLIAAACRPAAADTLDVPRLVGEMNRYCMAQVCAGMSVREAAALPGARLVLDRPLIGERLCNSADQQSVNGSFFAADGTRYEIGFYMIPGAGDERDVYRAVVLQLRRNDLSLEELDGLRRTLVDRYGLQPSGAPIPTAWFGSAPMLAVSVAQERVPEAARLVSTLRLVAAPIGAFAQTANAPWCLGDPVPPLPAPRPPLPRL